MAGRVKDCVPILRVADARISIAFYVDLLGFKKEWEHQFEPGLPLFLSVERDGIRLFLTEHAETAFGGLVYFYVEDVDGLAQEFAAKGADIGDGPIDQPWQTRELCFRDPDGNELRFGQPI